MKRNGKERASFFSANTASRLYLLAALLTAILTARTCSPRAAAYMDAAAARLEETRAVQSVLLLADRLQNGEGAIPVFAQSVFGKTPDAP